MHAKWTSGGVAHTHDATKNPGETDVQFVDRFYREIWKKWQNGEAPDNETQLEVSWMAEAGQQTVVTDDTYTTNRTFLDASLSAVQLSLESFPTL